jgi:ABC-type taurine transport system ATPase subunit
MSFELIGVSAPPLVGVSLQLTPGAWTVLGAPVDGTAQLIELAAGMSRPRIGRVLIESGDPRRSPAVRRRVASLLEREEPPLGRVVQDSVRAALELHGAAPAADSALSSLGLERWAERRVAQLDPRERRTLSLAIALAVPSPALVALHEPLAMTAGVERALVRTRLAALAAAGSVVVCTTASVRDALELGGRMLVLSRGRIVRELTDSTIGELGVGLSAELVIRSHDPRGLAAALASARDVLAVHFDERHAPGQLRVRGAELDALALEVSGVARAHGIRVQAIWQSFPSLQELQAASAGSARAAYDEAYRVAAEQARSAALPGSGAPEPGARS